MKTALSMEGHNTLDHISCNRSMSIKPPFPFPFVRCGLRGGYMELIGFDSAMMGQIYKMSSAMLCSTSVGQVWCWIHCPTSCAPLSL